MLGSNRITFKEDQESNQTSTDPHHLEMAQQELGVT